MPYTCKLDNGKYQLTKKNDSKVIGTHDNKKSCIKQMRAIYAEEMRRTENMVFRNYIELPYDFDSRIETAENEIHVIINSSGGDFLEAIVIHNKLRNSGKRIICHIDPFAFSAGAIVALAGDEIYMPENGLIKFHTPRVGVQKIGEAADFEKIASELRKAEDILVNTLKSRLKRDEEYCRELMNKDEYLTANEALRMGIIDDIVPIYRDSESRIENYNFPERIVNYIKEKRDMPLQDILQKFEVKDEDGLVNLIENLRKNQVKQPEVIKTSIVNMVKNYREGELTRLVDDGKCSPAVIQDLKTVFLNEDRIKLDGQLDDPNKEFDQMVAALKKNEKIINFDGKTKPQTTPLDKKQDEQNVDDDVLVRQMKKDKAAVAN